MDGSVAASADTQQRKKFILFVGNLTFDTTEEDLRAFFIDTKPTSLRLLTDKITKKSKGFAFVEFNGSKYLEAALKKDKTKLKGRKINIELTAGGGGSKSAVRKERIKAKNELLNKERSAKANADDSTGSKSKDRGQKRHSDEASGY